MKVKEKFLKIKNMNSMLTEEEKKKEKETEIIV